jgi:Ca2+-binding RTX toxin-like protein
LLGGDGEDILIGGSGDDTLSGGADADDFLFNPDNPNEGSDVITDFAVGEDKIVLSITDILSADPDLPAADPDGDPDALEIGDFDASDNWNVEASEDGDVTVVHPGGAFELDGIAFGDATDSFAELAALDTIELVP